MRVQRKRMKVREIRDRIVESFLLFNERLGLLALAGMVLTAAGVALVLLRPRAAIP